MKKVKIMMSSYNGEKYIEEQINSILEQKELQVDLFIRDDGSTDRTISILKRFASAHSNVHITIGENLGPSGSFMELLYSQGDDGQYDYYAFSDQDDIWHKDKLKRAVDFLENADVPALYYSALLTFQEKTGLQTLVVNKRNYTFTETFFQSFFPGCTMVMNNLGMELVKSIKKPDITIMHDLYLVQVFMGSDNLIIYDRDSRIDYRIHGNNVSVRKDSFIGEIRRYKRIWDNQKGMRLSAAQSYKEVMANLLDSDKLRQLEVITDYKKSFLKRCDLARLVLHTGFGFKIKLLFVVAIMVGFY